VSFELTREEAANLLVSRVVSYGDVQDQHAMHGAAEKMFGAVARGLDRYRARSGAAAADTFADAIESGEHVGER
jgi:hypothetical protein